MNKRTISKRMISMDDRTWARHANPWSGWSRILTLPLFASAFWSRAWIEWWSLALVAAAVFWTWLNPRLFPPPASTDNWMSKGVLGERLFLARKRNVVPKNHVRVALLLSGVSAAGMVPFAFGLYQLNLEMTVGGMCVTALAKLWFLDRMVWLYTDVSRGSSPSMMTRLSSSTVR